MYNQPPALMHLLPWKRDQGKLIRGLGKKISMSTLPKSQCIRCRENVGFRAIDARCRLVWTYSSCWGPCWVLEFLLLWRSQDSSSSYFHHPTPKKVKEGKENFPDSFFFFLLNKFSTSLYNKIHRKETRWTKMQTFPVLFLNHLDHRSSSLQFLVPLYWLSLGWGSPCPHGPVFFQPGGQRHLLATRAFAAGQKPTSSPCRCAHRCAPRWVPGAAWSCCVGFQWLDRKVPLNLHQGSPELLSMCFGVLGYTSHSLCVWLQVRRLSTRQVKAQLSHWSREGSMLCWQRQNTVQGLSHLFFLCHTIPFFRTANDAGESAHSLLQGVLQGMRQVTLRGAYAALKSKAVSQDRWIIRALEGCLCNLSPSVSKSWLLICHH